MKRYILITAAVLALMSCNKEATDPSTDETGKGTYFTEGQQVTITCGPQQTKVNGTENASKGIDFTWEEGDKIQVTVSGSPSEFTLSAGAGTATATFTGQMPGSGTTFDVQFPVSDPVLTSQTYVAGGLPHNMMKFAKTGCALGSAVALEAQYSALRLNIYGYNRQVNSIVVTDTTASPNVSYTLTCSSPVAIGMTEDTATPFLLVMPAGKYGFRTVVSCGVLTTGAKDLPTYEGVECLLVDIGEAMSDEIEGVSRKTFNTSSRKNFTAGTVLNMPSLAMTQLWAPVNCGYDSDNPYGLYYQFGRATGTAYESTATNHKNASYGSDGYYAELEDGIFYCYQDLTPETHDWYTNIPDNQFEKWPMKSTDPSYVAGKIDNPCPDGWVVPEWDDLGYLAFKDWDPVTHTGTTMRGSFDDVNNCLKIDDKFSLPCGGQKWYKTGVGSWQGFAAFYTSRYNKVSTSGFTGFRRSYSLKFSFYSTWSSYHTLIFDWDGNCSANTIRCIKDMSTAFVNASASVSASGFSEQTTW